MQDLILLHGALGHSNNFQPYEKLLSEHFKIHKILFHGHGGTAIPESGLSISLYLKQVQEYVETNRLTTFHIFGYSMGGYVGLAYAALFSEQVISILTLATKLLWTIEGAAKEVKMLNADLIAEKVPKYAAQLASLHGANHWKPLLPAVAELMTRLAADPLLDQERYASIKCPVQLMVGDKDIMVGIEETLEAVKSISGANFAVLPQTKHPIESIRTTLLIDMMKDFWKV